MRRFVLCCAVSHILIGTGVCLLLSGCAHAVSALGAGAAHGGDAGPCTVQELSREPLMVQGGRALYVQPVVLEPNGRGETLLAGDISFLLARQEGEWRFARRDSTFGAVLPRQGEPRLVVSPIPTRLLANVRAAARDDGSWSVVFGELPEHSGTRPDTLAALWAGTLDGGRWTRLERIPLPPGGVLASTHASRLLVRADTLFLAVTLRDGVGFRHVALFSRSAAGWRSEVVPTRFDLYPRLAYSDSLGVVLASVGGSGAAASADNAVVLWGRAPGWRPMGRITAPGAEAVHDPWLSLDAGREVLSWEAEPARPGAAGWEARAIVDPLQPEARVAVLDSSITPVFGAVRPVEVSPGVRLWALDHVEPDGSAREIRILRERGGDASVIAGIPNPYGTEFAAALAAPDELLLAGGFIDPGRGSPVSLLIRFRVRCS